MRICAASPWWRATAKAPQRSSVPLISFDEAVRLDPKFALGWARPPSPTAGRIGADTIARPPGPKRRRTPRKKRKNCSPIWAKPFWRAVTTNTSLPATTMQPGPLSRTPLPASRITPTRSSPSVLSNAAKANGRRLLRIRSRRPSAIRKICPSSRSSRSPILP